MVTAAMARLLMSRLWPLVALLFWLAGCVTPAKHTVLFHENTNARLATRHENGLFLTQVRIGDREAGPFLIDSGAAGIILDSRLGEVVPLSFWGESDDPHMKQPIKWGTLASLDVGPLTLQNTNIGVLDLSTLDSIFKEKLAGLLGHPFFAQVVVEIDYPARSITCFDPKHYRLPRGDWLPLTLRNKRPIIPARLEGHIDGEFMLDTGSTHSVMFYPDFIRKHALLDNRNTRRQKTGRVEGVYETLAAEIAWFELAGHRFEAPTVNFASSDMPEVSVDGVAGVIGEGFLRRFVVVLNYPEAKIALLPK